MDGAGIFSWLVSSEVLATLPTRFLFQVSFYGSFVGVVYDDYVVFVTAITAA